MRTTVVVATVGRTHLETQLAALTEQTSAPDQVILVNNGAPGAVAAVYQRWREQLSLELVEDRSVPNPSHARNVGAAAARHPGLLFLDDDDEVGPGYVAAMAAALDTADLVAGRIELARLNPPGLTAHWGDMQTQGPITYHDFLPWISGCAMAVRRDVFDQVGGFDERLDLVEDTDLCWRLQLGGPVRLAFAPDAVLHYRLRDTPRSAFRQARQWAIGEAQLVPRFGVHGMPDAGRSLGQVARSARRWARPVQLAVTARSRDDLTVMARLLGGCVGRLVGGLRPTSSGPAEIRPVHVHPAADPASAADPDPAAPAPAITR